MSLSSDLLVDRRQLRRQLTFWRVVAFAIALIVLVGAGLYMARGSIGGSTAHVARIEIEGLITGRQETLDLIARAERSNASAVVLRINSGGGTTSGSEALYLAVKRLAAKKPVVAVIGGVGASGAYMTAMGAERIYANGSSVVGSIGVIAQIPNLVKLLDTIGVKVEAVRSTPLKAMPSGVETTTPEARQALEETVLESYQWFRGLVSERRKLEGEKLDKVSDGRVFSGRQALELKLIDAVGDERDAIAWLETEKNLAKGLPIRSYKTPESYRGLGGFFALDGLARMVGLDTAGQLGDAARQLIGANALDGLLSVWHP